MNIALDVLSAIFWGVLLLSILVVVHEFGHYLMARAFGVRVTEFFIGLPSRWRISRKSKSHGTEFGITPLLLGGYNRICGMEAQPDELSAQAFGIVQREGRVRAADVATELDVDEERAYDVLGGLSDYAAIRPYFNPELGEYPTQRDYPEAFETLARDAQLRTEYDSGHDFSAEGSTEAAQPRPLDDAEAQLAVEIGHTYAGISYPKRLAILLAGPLVNLILAFILVTAAYLSVEYTLVVNENIVASVEEGSLAEAAGLRDGDAITSIDGTQTTDWASVSAALQSAREKGEDFPLVYVRDGQEHSVVVDLPEGQTVDAIGVRPKTQPYRLTPLEAMHGALSYAGQVVSVVVKLLIPQHTMEVLDQSSSIVGISVMAAQAASTGLLDVIALLASISMSLGFMNLLPIPPLDGGKIVVETIQALVRRPVPPKVVLAFSYVGIAFFVFVFVIVVRNDVMRMLAG